MIKRIFQLIFSLSGLALGVFLASFAKNQELFKFPTGFWGGVIYILAGLFLAIIFFIISPKLFDFFSNKTKKLEKELEKVPVQDVILGAFGLIVGLIIAFFISQPFDNLPIIGTVLSVAIYLAMGYLGMKLALRNRNDLLDEVYKSNLFKLKHAEEKHMEEKQGQDKLYKVLDTSVIIDGRIVDIVKAGFIEGTLVIPNFVLLELQHIADSADDLRRERGRRGLDVLKAIQDQTEIEVIISSSLYEDIEEVDSKLLALTEDLKGKVVTNDYNLNKVAEVRGISVLNINELANAVKAPVLHGEVISVNIIKEGSSQGQGVAYLDDGTMIVVEGGRDYVGENVKVEVTSVIQTSAGKMIFTKIK